MRRLRRWLGGCLGVLALAGCGAPPPLRIGFVAELSGRSSDLGESARNGFLLALDDSRRRGVPARPVEVLMRDVGAGPEAERQSVQELVAGGVDVVVGPMTSAMVDVVQPITEPAGVLMISPTASAAKYRGKDDLLFRINWTTREDASHYAEYYWTSGVRRVAVAVNGDNRAFSESWLEEFSKTFEALGGKVLTTQTFKSNSVGYEAVCRPLVATRPDAVVLIANAVDSARLAQQVRKLAPEMPLIAAEWAGASQLIELGGRAVEGLRLGQNYDHGDTSPRFTAFREAYQLRYGKMPAFGAVLGYDTATVLLEALDRRTPGMSVKEALLRFGPYPGLQQQVVFDANGDAERAIYFMVVRDGRFVAE